jgi:hypothetical protein
MPLILGFILVALAAAGGIAILLALRTRAPEGGRFNDGDRAAGVFGVLATGFSILLGFIVFLAFTSYDTARTGAEAEAQFVLQQYETAQLLPEPAAGELAAQLICYGRYVVHREWPALEDGEGSDVSPWGLAMFRTIEQVEPGTAAEEAAFSKWLDQTSDREDARLDRVHGAEGIVPTTLWIVLLLSALVIFVFMLFFAGSGERAVVQALQIGAVIVVIGAMLLLIRYFDRPYQSGFGGIDPVAMERTLTIIESDEVAAITSRDDPPCTTDGDPL